MMSENKPGLTLELQAKLSALAAKSKEGFRQIADDTMQRMDAARVATEETATPPRVQGEESGLPSSDDPITVGQSGERADQNDHHRIEDTVIFSEVNRDNLEKDIREKTDYRGKLLAVRKSLGALGGICREISDRKGWSILVEVVKDLPEKNLIDQVYWKKKFGWTDKQLDALNANKQDEVVSAKELEYLFLSLHDLLAASQRVLFELRQSQKTRQDIDGDKEVLTRRVSFAERLKRVYTLAEEWEKLMIQFGQEPNRFYEAVGIELNQKRILNVKHFVDELEEQGKQHDWKGEASKGDKTDAVKKLSYLEVQVAAARAVIGKLKQQLPKEDQKTPVSSPVATEPAVSSSPDAIPPTPFVVPEPITAQPRNAASPDKPHLSHLDIENGLLNLKQHDKELWYRGPSGEWFIVRPTRNQDVFELWQPGDMMSRHHYRELASWLYARNVTFAGKKKQPENMADPSKEERREAQKQLKRILEHKLTLFAERMDTHLRQENPSLSYAKRRGRILSQLPEFAEQVIEHFGKGLTLSSSEQEAMIEENTASIKIQR